MHSISGKIGCTTETLRDWILQVEARTNSCRNEVLADRERVKQPERENTELRRANVMLRKASAVFAQPELDRRGK